MNSENHNILTITAALIITDLKTAGLDIIIHVFIKLVQISVQICHFNSVFIIKSL